MNEREKNIILSAVDKNDFICNKVKLIKLLIEEEVHIEFEDDITIMPAIERMLNEITAIIDETEKELMILVKNQMKGEN